jgi:hypothetical protein
MPSKFRRALGCDLTKVPKAADTPKVDFKKILSVDSSNPFLRQLRIQQGFLVAQHLPAELRAKVPPPEFDVASKGDLK